MLFSPLTRRFLALTALLLTVAFQPLSAQVQLGIAGGANFASLSDIRTEESAVSFDNASAFHIGVFLDLKLGPLNARPALYYLNAGALFNGTSVIQDDNFDVSYVTIPVDFIFNLGLGPIKPYFFLGPEFRFFASGDVPEDVERGLNDFVMIGSAGLGIRINVPVVGITLLPQLRYSFGLSSYTRSSYEVQGITVDANDANVRMWLLTLGIGF